jgi:hypothetical protein
VKFAYRGKSELVGRGVPQRAFERTSRRHALPGYAARRARRRLPRGIGLTLALFVSLGLWALLAYAATRLFDLL